MSSQRNTQPPIGSLPSSHSQKRQRENNIPSQPQSPIIFFKNNNQVLSPLNQLEFIASKQFMGNEALLQSLFQNKNVQGMNNLQNNVMGNRQPIQILLVPVFQNKGSMSQPFLSRIHSIKSSESSSNNQFPRTPQKVPQTSSSNNVKMRSDVSKQDLTATSKVIGNREFINEEKESAPKSNQIEQQQRTSNKKVSKNIQKIKKSDEQSDISENQIFTRLRRKKISSFSIEETDSSKNNQECIENTSENVVIARKKSKTMSFQQKEIKNIESELSSPVKGNSETMIDESKSNKQQSQREIKNPNFPVNLSLVQSINKNIDNKFGQELINDQLIPKLQELTLIDQKITPKKSIEMKQSFQNTHPIPKPSKTSKTEMNKRSENLFELEEFSQTSPLIKAKKSTPSKRKEQQQIPKPFNPVPYPKKSKSQFKNSITSQEQEGQDIQNEEIKSPFTLENVAAESPLDLVNGEFKLEKSTIEQQPKKYNKNQRKYQSKVSLKLQNTTLQVEQKEEEQFKFSNTSPQVIPSTKEEKGDQKQKKKKNRDDQKQLQYPSTPVPSNVSNTNIFPNIHNSGYNLHRQCQSENIQHFKNNTCQDEQNLHQINHQSFNQDIRNFNQQQVNFANQQMLIERQSYQNQFNPINGLFHQQLIQYNQFTNQDDQLLQQLTLEQQAQLLQRNDQQQNNQRNNHFQYQIPNKPIHSINNQHLNRTLFSEEDERLNHIMCENVNNYYLNYPHQYQVDQTQDLNILEDEKIFEIIGEIKEDPELISTNMN